MKENVFAWCSKRMIKCRPTDVLSRVGSRWKAAPDPFEESRNSSRVRYGKWRLSLAGQKKKLPYLLVEKFTVKNRGRVRGIIKKTLVRWKSG